MAMITFVEVSAVFSIIATICGGSIGVWKAGQWFGSVNTSLNSVKSELNIISNNHIPHLQASMNEMKIQIQKLEDKIK